MMHFLFTIILPLILLTQPSEAHNKSEYKAKTVYLHTGNTLNIRGPVTSNSVAQWSKKLAELKRGRYRHKPVYLVINSPGGSISAGIDFIRFANQFRNVHTITLDAASMGSAIAQGVHGKRYYTPSSVMMFHRAWAQISGQVEEGELESRLRLIKKLVLYMENINAKRMSIPLKSYKKKVLNEWWLYGDDIGKEKAGDSEVVIKCSSDLMEETEDVKRRGFFGLVTLRYSKCPLITGPIN